MEQVYIPTALPVWKVTSSPNLFPRFMLALLTVMVMVPEPEFAFVTMPKASNRVGSFRMECGKDTRGNQDKKYHNRYHTEDPYFSVHVKLPFGWGIFPMQTCSILIPSTSVDINPSAIVWPRSISIQQFFGIDFGSLAEYVVSKRFSCQHS